MEMQKVLCSLHAILSKLHFYEDKYANADYLCDSVFFDA